MLSINQSFFNVTVNSDSLNLSTDSFNIHFNEVNITKSKYNDISYQFICENWGSGGAGGGQ